MATIKATVPANWTNTEHTANTQSAIWSKYVAYADSQKGNHTLWFFIVLMLHGVLFLPVPAVLMYYFNASSWVLVVTMICFFTNFIANMCGAGTRATIAFLAISIVLHVAMILAVVL